MSVKEWFANVRVKNRSATWLTLTPHQIRVKLPITSEVFSSEFRWVDNGELGNTLIPTRTLCGCTVEIYAGTTPADLNLLFRGRVSKAGEEYTGMFKEKAERYITAYGLGRPLQVNEMYENVPAGNVVEQFTYVASIALAESLITGYDISNLVTTYNMRKKEGKRSYWDVLQSIAREADWDFYVDNDGTLRAFPRGSLVYSGSIVPDFRARIEYDDSRIINSINVYGMAGETIGSDEEYTEDNWATYWEGDGIQEDTSTVKVGNKAVRFYKQNLGPKAVFSFGNTVDLSLGGRIHFYVYIRCEDIEGSPSSTSLEIRCYTSDSDYFVKELEVAGGKVWKYYSWAGLAPKGYTAEWFLLEVGYNNYDQEGWTEINNPKWTEISSISIELKYPLGVDNVMIIDDFYIKDQELVARAVDTVSINLYGVRKGPSLRDGNIRNTLEAQVIADALINLYKDPTIMIMDVEVEDTFSLPLGYEVTVSVYGTKIPVTVRELNFEFDGKRLIERANFGERYLPSIETLFKDAIVLLRAVNWNVELFRKLFGDMARIDTASGLIDYDRISRIVSYESWVDTRKVAVIAESKDGYVAPYREQWFNENVDVGVGQFSAWTYGEGNYDGPWLCAKKMWDIPAGTIFWKCQMKAQWDQVEEVSAVCGVGYYPDALYPACFYVTVNSNGESSLGWADDLERHFLLCTFTWNAWHLLEFRYFNNRKELELYVNNVPRKTIPYTFPARLSPFYLFLYDKNNTPVTLHIQTPMFAVPWYND